MKLVEAEEVEGVDVKVEFLENPFREFLLNRFIKTIMNDPIYDPQPKTKNSHPFYFISLIKKILRFATSANLRNSPRR